MPSQEIYRSHNEKSQKSYEESLKAIQAIQEETKVNKSGEKGKYYNFFNQVSSLILKLAQIEKKGDAYFSENSLEELQKDNDELFGEIKPENYETSFANPTYSVGVFGDGIGQLLSYFYSNYRGYIDHAFRHKAFKMEEHNKLFIDVFDYVKNNDVQYDELKAMITSIESENLVRNQEIIYKENYDKNYTFYNDIILNSDLKDPRYLYKFGRGITEHEIKYAKYISGRPEEVIKKVSSAVVKGFMNSFERDKKNRGNRSTVNVLYRLGQERIIKQVIEDFKARDIEALVHSVTSTKLNRQHTYDHDFDAALYLDKEFVDKKLAAREKAAKNCREVLEDNCGTVYFDSFGEPEFSPQPKEERLTKTEEQSRLDNQFYGKARQVREEYIPGVESSFSMIAFPTPEIGEKFEEIHEECLKINTLDNKMFRDIQQRIIDVLDKGEFVRVKGKGGNETEISVKLHELKDPEKETNFFNCEADVNIPVGEVFTSPQLKGTNGVLHLKKAYLEGLLYEDLKLTFKDGYVTEYSCKNFDDEEKNKKYIEENLLYPHKTLPLGEFAIGTNTFAYAMAKKYNIIDILPILIVEKMGPHFAIGDTCYSYEEDNLWSNYDGKRIIAVDNEQSILRKDGKLDEAYTNVHTDITLPYDELENISVVAKDGQVIDIIRDGRFVLAGTEELNKAFEN